jgi:hypothetical protein
LSQTSSVNYYRIDGNVGDANQQDNFTIQLSSSCGMTDDAFLNLARAIKNVTWPAGISMNLWVSKNDQNTVSSTGDLAANPAAFI